VPLLEIDDAAAVTGDGYPLLAPDELWQRTAVDGTALADERGRRLSIKHCRIGDLDLPEGRLAVCDPFVDPKGRVLTQHVPAGLHPVELRLARFEDNNDERVIVAVLRFTDRSPARFVPTRFEGVDEPINHLPHAYGVDAGIGCFAAPGALAERAKKPFESSDAELDAFQARYVHTWSWLLTGPVDRPPQIAMFSSGFGDGAYGTWLGLDDQDRVACAMTDFGVLP
jgi:hypothetical protein